MPLTERTLTVEDHSPVRKQHINSKFSREVKLVALSDYVSASIHLRKFLLGRLAMALIERGKPAGSGSRHIDIWIKDRVEAGEEHPYQIGPRIAVHHRATDSHELGLVLLGTTM